jgi:DNA-binding CsgD family transcriptional regulator
MTMTAERRSDVLDRCDGHLAVFDSVLARRRSGPWQTAFPETEPPREPSARELQVLDLVARGLTTTEAARVLHLSKDTVKTHLANLRMKLQARNRAHAVTLAFRLGLLELGEHRPETASAAVFRLLSNGASDTGPRPLPEKRPHLRARVLPFRAALARP